MNGLNCLNSLNDSGVQPLETFELLNLERLNRPIASAIFSIIWCEVCR